MFASWSQRNNAVNLWGKQGKSSNKIGHPKAKHQMQAAHADMPMMYNDGYSMMSSDSYRMYADGYMSAQYEQLMRADPAELRAQAEVLERMAKDCKAAARRHRKASSSMSEASTALTNSFGSSAILDSDADGEAELLRDAMNFHFDAQPASDSFTSGADTDEMSRPSAHLETTNKSVDVPAESLNVECAEVPSAEAPIVLAPWSSPKVNCSETLAVPESRVESSFFPPPGLSGPPGLCLTSSADSQAGKVTTDDGSTEYSGLDQEKSKKPRSTEGSTTLMIKNCPNDLLREDLCGIMDARGLKGLYDFVYLPVDLLREANLGYCFVNFVSHEAACLAWEAMDGYQSWTMKSQKVCSVTWGEPLQGLTEHIERYRDSPVMHRAVADRFKPIILQDGVRIPFPAPTKRVRAPRMKRVKPMTPTA